MLIVILTVEVSLNHLMTTMNLLQLHSGQLTLQSIRSKSKVVFNTQRPFLDSVMGYCSGHTTYNLFKFKRCKAWFYYNRDICPNSYNKKQVAKFMMKRDVGCIVYRLRTHNVRFVAPMPEQIGTSTMLFNEVS